VGTTHIFTVRLTGEFGPFAELSPDILLAAFRA
jgi:hypothetical protein